MTNRAVLKAIAVLAAMYLFTAVVARAAEPGVHDDANLFKPGTVQRVDDIAKQIKHDYHYDLVVETFESVPPELKDREGQVDRNKFYDEWLTANARKQGVRGVYILIVKQTGRLQIGVGHDTRQKAFTDVNRDTLRTQMIDAFRAKQLDDGLINGAAYIEQTMAANLGQPIPAPEAAAPTTQPSTTQPSTTQPSTTQPSTTQPSTTQPSTTQPGTAQATTAASNAPVIVGASTRGFDTVSPTTAPATAPSALPGDK